MGRLTFMDCLTIGINCLMTIGNIKSNFVQNKLFLKTDSFR